MSLRLFAAASIPDEIAIRLTPLQRGVHGASWRPRENLHLTLRFFGQIGEDVAVVIDLELGRIRAAPFEARLVGAGWFGTREPRVLWAGVEDDGGLRALAEKCERAARRAGLAPDTRRFTPHVTLAYCRGTLPNDAAKFAQRVGGFRSDSFVVDRFFMFSSWMGKGPSRYVEEAVYPLIG